MLVTQLLLTRQPQIIDSQESMKCLKQQQTLSNKTFLRTLVKDYKQKLVCLMPFIEFMNFMQKNFLAYTTVQSDTNSLIIIRPSQNWAELMHQETYLLTNEWINNASFMLLFNDSLANWNVEKSRQEVPRHEYSIGWIIGSIKANDVYLKLILVDEV
ncbi:UNKNOWN [Stylonychia lemnae]|uniref:Uncharacterized protein n=1 Tax=Stylonychia lemnae TaxID=5949 RepID=A0A078A0T5_STYLE|nr:UNKNOWN [Stylonychia lemnae]|eukprot:CDW75078.1 UNKNOWN [Stylonychia lemnae]